MKKNYMKLIGSIMCALGVIVTVALISIGAQAEEKEITYIENVTYSADNTAPATPTGYEGYLFAGWYVKGGETQNAAGYSPVAEPVEGTAYCAKYVPAEVLGVKAQISGQIKDNETDKIQNNTEDNVIRFVTSLDSTEYQHIGFNIKIAGTSYDQDAATTKNVYTTIYGIGADKSDVMDYSPTIFHKQSVYFKTYAFTTIPEVAFDSDITVTPYWITLDGTRVDGTATEVRTVNYCRSWYYVDSTGVVTNSAAPVGTDSNPYTTLANAVAVETELNPKLILKSDTTIDATVDVARTMTIEGSDDTAKTITYNTDEEGKYIFTVAETGNITLNDLHLSGGYRAIQNSNGYVSATNVEITDCAEMCIRLDGGEANLTNVTITGGKRGLQLYSSAKVTGSYVNIYGPTAHGIACGASKLDITNLTIDGTLDGVNKLTSHAMNVYGGSEVTVTKGNIQNIKNINGVNAGLCEVTLNEVNITYDAASEAEVDGIKAYYEGTIGPAVVSLNKVEISNAPRYGIQVSGGSQVTGDTVTINSSVSSGIKCTETDSKFDIKTLNVSNSKSHGVELTEEGTGSISGGSISSSAGKGIYLHKEEENGVTGASITLENFNINNSTGENLYLNNASSATVNGTLTTNGGNTYSLAIYNASILEKGDSYSKITIQSPTGIGVRLYNSGSQLNVGDMALTGCKNQGVYIRDNAQAVFDGNVNIEGASSGDFECLYLYDASSKATVNGTLTTTGGRYGLAIYNGADVIKGENGGTITINSPRSNGVRLYDSGSSLDIDVLNVNNSAGHALEVNKGSATINGGLLTVSSSASGNIFAVKAATSADVTLNNVEIRNPIYHGMAVWSQSSVTGSNLTISQANGHGIHCGDSGSNFNITNLIISGSNNRAVNLYSGASATINGGTFTSPQVGAYVENNSTLTLTGTLTVNTPSDRGIQNVGATVAASDATVIVNSPTKFGISTNVYSSDSATIPGTTTIGVLNVSGAKGFSSVTVNGTGSVVTINGGKIENSTGHGVSAEYGTLNLNNVEITGSGTDKCDVWAQKGSTINLTNMINADSLTKGYDSYDESAGETQGTINE